MTKARGCCRPVSFVVGLLLAGFLSGCGSPALDGPGDDAASSTHDEGSEDEDEPGGGDATSDERGGGAGGSTDDEASTGGAPGTVTRSVSARWLIAQPTRRSRNGKARVGRPYRTGTTGAGRLLLIRLTSKIEAEDGADNGYDRRSDSQSNVRALAHFPIVDQPERYESSQYR